MVTYHGIDWKAAERRIENLAKLRAYADANPGARVAIIRGEPRMTMPTNIYLTRWQWAKGRREATDMEYCRALGVDGPWKIKKFGVVTFVVQELTSRKVSIAP